MYKIMPEYPEIYDEVYKIPDFIIEMSKEEVGVLSGLIRERAPQKIVEIGVASGGSTCLILKCLENLGLTRTKLYSIDLNEKLWFDNTKETGWLLKNNIDKFSNCNNVNLLIGKYAVDRIDEIGENVDFLFLDTVHHIPGEILDFLLFLPHLSSNAVVVLHDTNLHNIHIFDKESICTRVLVNTVKAEKYYIPQKKYLNIGAFKITKDTKKYIEDVFASLLLPWFYQIDKEILNKYKDEYKKYYSNIAINIWDNAVECEEKRFQMELEEIYLKEVKRLKKVFTSNKKVYIYGCGYRGKKLLKYIRANKYEIEGIIVSDGEFKEEYNNIGGEIYEYSKIKEKLDQSIILIAVASQEVRNLLEKNVHNFVDINGNFFELIESER